MPCMYVEINACMQCKKQCMHACINACQVFMNTCMQCKKQWMHAYMYVGINTCMQSNKQWMPCMYECMPIIYEYMHACNMQYN